MKPTQNQLKTLKYYQISKKRGFYFDVSNVVDRAYDWELSSFRKFVSEGFYDRNWCDFIELKDFQ